MKSDLPANHGLAADVRSIPGLVPVENGSPSITDVQFDALAAGVARGEDVLVSAPTSTGKTLIGWWTIASSLEAGGRAVYLVSHRTLAKQKFEEAQRLFLDTFLDEDRSQIVCATGDSVEDASGRKTSAPLAASIVVATYEKYLGCLSTGGPPRDLSDVTFVCDEVQLIGDKTRGKTVELLLTLLKRSGWRQFIGLSAVLSNKDANDLASWLSLRLVRNPAREKALELTCRTNNTAYSILFAPSRDGDWQADHSHQIVDTLGIVRELHRNADQKPVIVFCMKVDETFELAGALAAQLPASAPVVPPPGLEIGPELLRLLSKRVAYHNAELGEEERLFIEHLLSTGVIDTVFATSTLAAGVNFPLGSAAFAAWKRWNPDRRERVAIGAAEFQNMAGRVGRMGQVSSKGRVVATAASSQDATVLRGLMNLGSQEDLGIGIKPAEFGPLVLQIFAGNLCSSRDEAFGLLASTLSAAREADRNLAGLAHWRAALDIEIDRLIGTNCLLEGRSKIVVTTLGLSVARSGLKPETAIYFFEGLADVADSLIAMLPTPEEAGQEDDLLFIMAHAALASPEFTREGGVPTRGIHWRIGNPGIILNPYAPRLDRLLFEQPWLADVSAANGALLLTKWSAGCSRDQAEGIIPSVRVGTIQALARDVAWILTGISEIVSAVTAPALADESKPELLRSNAEHVVAIRQLARAMRRQAARISAGLPSESLWLMSLDLQQAPRRLSRKQILALRGEGMARAINLMSGDPESDQARRRALDAITNPQLANAVRSAARRWKIEDRTYCKRLQSKRASQFGASSAIEAFYDARNDAFEVAFEGLMSFAAIDFQKLDGRGKIGHPDYMVDIEGLPGLVFELKTKASDEDVVSYNHATEVLAASEIIGMRDNFCVTLCNPGIEPSVPGLIEACGRLCVVDACDFAEAILRVREGRLTRADLHNWLTTPGIALREDLPPPPR